MRYRRKNRKSLAPGLAAGSIAILAIAVGGTLFATGVLPPKPPQSQSQPDAITVTVKPESAAQLVSPLGEVRVDLPAGSVDRPVKFSYRQVPAIAARELPAGFVLTDKMFDLSVDGGDAAASAEFTFLKPITVTVGFGAEEAELSDGVASNMVIQHFKEGAGGWTPLHTKVNFQTSEAQAQIDILSTFALTIKKPSPPVKLVAADEPLLPHGYLGQGFARLTVPEELAADETAGVRLEITLREVLQASDIVFVVAEYRIAEASRQPRSPAGPPLTVARYEDVPVYNRMGATLTAPAFSFAPEILVDQSLSERNAIWSWSITPAAGTLGPQEITVLISANGRTMRTLKAIVKVTPPASTTSFPSLPADATPVPEPTPVSISTPAPGPTLASPTAPAPTVVPNTLIVPTVTPVPTATATPVPSLVPTAIPVPVTKPPPAPTATPIPTPIPTPTASPTPTPSGPPTPTPVPRYRLFINEIPTPPQNSRLFITGGTVTLSQAPKSDGAFRVNTSVTILVSPPLGFDVTWGGVDSQRGLFATVEMVTDRYVTISITPPVPTATPTRTPFPWEVPTATPVPTAVPVPTPIPVPTASPIQVGTPTPVPPPTPTPTALPAGAPTHTPLPTYRLTTSASPTVGGTVSPSGTTTHNAGTQVFIVASNAGGYIFSAWSGACSGSGSCLVTMDGDKSVTANFLQVFTLTTSASPSEGGAVSPAGSNNYTSGAQVPVTASPAGGYQFSSWSGDCSGSGSCLVTMDADKTVTAGFELAPTPTPPPPSLSGRMAFYSSADGNDEIYVMNADGSGQSRLTNQALDDRYPSWSPDGSKIAFASGRDGGNLQIYVMNADGSAQVRVTNTSANDVRPSWSPDGAKIAFGSNRDGNSEIYVMNADGSAQTRLTNSSVQDDSPSWSPDGAKIAFQSARDGNWEIYVMNSDGSGQINLTNDPFADDSPSWSPDGAKIAFRSARDAGNTEIYVMNGEGSNQVRITNNPAVEQGPDWGP